MNPDAQRRAGAFAAAIAAWREDIGTPAEAGRALGVTPEWIMRVERGVWDPHAMSPSLAILVMQGTGLDAAALGIEIDAYCDDPVPKRGIASAAAPIGAAATSRPIVGLVRRGDAQLVSIAIGGERAALSTAQAADLIDALAQHLSLALA